MSNRYTPVVALLIGVAVLVGGWGVAWKIAASRARDAVTTWAERQRAEGMGVHWSEMTTDGFPSRVVLTLRDPQVRFPASAGGGGWAAPVLSVSAAPWAPRHLTITAPGEHLANFVADGQVFQTRTTAAQARLELELDDDGSVLAADAALADLRTEGLLPGGPVTLDALAADFVHNPGGAASFLGRREETETGVYAALSATLTGLTLPQAVATPLGSRVQTAELSAAMTGDLPAGESLRERVRGWSEEGGTVEIDRLRVVADPLSLAAAGTLTLDKWLQPQMALSSQIRGFFEALDVLVEKDLIRGRDASIAKVVLGVMAKQPPDGGPAALELPITVQERMLYLGPVALAKLPPLRWGGQAPPGPGEIKPGFEIGRDGEITRTE